MAEINEGNYLSDWLAFEEDNRFSREKVTFSADVKCGEVVGKVTADGSYAPYSSGNADGTENAAGIALDDYAAGSEGVAIVRHAQVVVENLTGADATAMDVLATLGIVKKEQG